MRATQSAFKIVSALTILAFWSILSSSAPAPAYLSPLPMQPSTAPSAKHFSFPYAHAGFTERQAAAHLLDRFTYGAIPGQVDQVVRMGLEKWFTSQLTARTADDSLDAMLKGYDAIRLSNTEVVNLYPRAGVILRMAIQDGIVDKDSVKTDKVAYKEQLENYRQQKGFKPEKELFRQFINQKILRSVYTNNQLQEVLTDFWFNHFNVSITKNDCSEFIPAYERDVIRPNVLGPFDQLLLATAKSPAMLYYLDNFSSASADSTNARRNPNAKNTRGLNENYAREVMELHTLGVDGGYTQHDVTEAARVLTGWTVYPMNDFGYGNAMRKLVDRVGEDNLSQRGFVHEGDFLFTPNRHDRQEKTVLGTQFAANGGYEEGVRLLEMLAHHPSTAKFICRKIAVRFVSDAPPQTLIDKMVKTFLEQDGDIRQVLVTMASAPEFWTPEAVRQKTKSPFELAISTIRSLDATVKQPYPIYQWVSRMGQRMYFYQAPTGFPDKGVYWINTGALLNRMNFGLAFASQRIPGISFDLAALNNHHEPESAQAALITYSKLIMPERDLDATIKRLTPLLNDPELVQKVDHAAGRTSADSQVTGSNEEILMNDGPALRNNSMLSQVVGIIIGSPEFQRR
jgi:uncharacterized protein (DUF1800 family)